MTNDVTCTYPGDREGAIIDFLYGEADSSERAVFGRHVEGCAACRAEVDAYRGVRRALAEWAPPEPARTPELAALLTGPRLAVAKETAPAPSASSALSAPASPAASRLSLASVPSWARVAAAVLCIGVGAGAANLRVTYSPQGLTVSTGWLNDGPPLSPANPSVAEPWRSEVAALSEQIRDMQSRPAPRLASVAEDAGGGTQSGATGGDDAVLRQVRALIARSEQRQQRELALRLGDALNDVHVQRRADLARIDRAIGVMQSSTGMDLLRQREAINTLAVRVSSQR